MRCRDLLTSQPEPLLVPSTVMVEVCWLLEERLKITTVASLDGRHFPAFRPRHCEALTLLPDRL